MIDTADREALYGRYESLRDLVIAHCSSSLDDRLETAWRKALEDLKNEKTTLEAIHEWVSTCRKALADRTVIPAYWPMPTAPTIDAKATETPHKTRKTRSDKGIPKGPRKATGGIVRSPAPLLAGERGCTLVVPKPK